MRWSVPIVASQGKLGLEPAWVEDLLVGWAVGDTRGGSRGLGWSRTSPMFARLGEAAETDSDDSYSDLELAAMACAIEKLQSAHPLEWQAVLAAFKPWCGMPTDPAMLASAARRLAGWVDDLVDKGRVD